MREIKFRAWDKKDKRMISNPLATDINSASNYIGLNDLLIKYETSGYILMQYTGLKDKNGKEIYEGDVVKSRGYNDIDEEERVFIDTVEFNGGAFSPICFEKCENFEVIGNIYENPELLNK